MKAFHEFYNIPHEFEQVCQERQPILFEARSDTGEGTRNRRRRCAYLERHQELMHHTHAGENWS